MFCQPFFHLLIICFNNSNGQRKMWRKMNNFPKKWENSFTKCWGKDPKNFPFLSYRYMLTLSNLTLCYYYTTVPLSLSLRWMKSARGQLYDMLRKKVLVGKSFKVTFLIVTFLWGLVVQSKVSLTRIINKIIVFV